MKGVVINTDELSLIYVDVGGRRGYDCDKNRGGYIGYSNNDSNKMHSQGSDYRVSCGV